MKLNLGSIEFGVSILNGGDTPAWGTELGQGSDYHLTIEGLNDLLTAMVYNAVPNTDVDCVLGKGGSRRDDYEFVLSSKFEKVFVNEKNVPNAKFVLLIVKQIDGEHHTGRRTLKYGTTITYKGNRVNEDTYRKIKETLGLTSDGAFFINEINFRNQDEIHFTAYVVNETKTQVYESVPAKKEDYKKRIYTTPTFSPIPTTNTPQQQQFLSNLLAAIRTKPFILLAGISGTGKSQLVRRLAQATNDINVTDDTRFKEPNPVNFKLIQVKPNWHNSMEVIGYKTNIPTDHYVLTEFIRFIARAWAFPNTPFFLCLDEMNLAPVEEYFAEFLSAIESRTKNTSNGYSTDPIIPPFDNYGKVVASQLVTDLLTDKLLAETPQRDTITKTWCEKGLSLPENLIVMGTVNMDETTFSFSKKVLDRAMSIEMNVVNYDAYLSQTSDPINVKLVDYNNFITDRPIEGATITNIDKQDIVTWLQNINQILDNTPFKLGYRAINEAILYISATTALKVSIDVAKDQFAMMKILSRIEGDDSKIGDILDKLKEPLNGPLCTKKLTDMQQLLNTNQFTSFWN